MPIVNVRQDARHCGHAFVERRECPVLPPLPWGSDRRRAWADGHDVARWIGPDTIALDCSGASVSRGAWGRGGGDSDTKVMIQAIGAAAQTADLNVVCQRFPASGKGRRRQVRISDVERSPESEREIDYVRHYQRTKGKGTTEETAALVEAMEDRRRALDRDRRRMQREVKSWFADVCLLAWAWVGGDRPSDYCHQVARREGVVGGRTVRVSEGQGLRDRMTRWETFERMLEDYGVPEDPPHGLSDVGDIEVLRHGRFVVHRLLRDDERRRAGHRQE